MAKFGDPFVSEEITGLDLGDEVYVGLFVCSHNKDVVEKAVFSNVRITIPARSSDEEPETPFVEYLRALHAKKPLDLIVSIGAPAAAFVQRHRADLFANTPMVFTAVDGRRVQSSLLTPGDVVVAVRIDYLEAMKNILQVLPNTRNIVVVVGMSPIEKFWKEEIGSSVASLSDRVTFVDRRSVVDEILNGLRPVAGYRDLLGIDDRRCGRCRARGQHCAGPAPCCRQRADLFL
jgi:hypothetical protein